MKYLKRYLSVIMVVTMVIAMTAACGAKENANESDGSETKTEVADVESEPEIEPDAGVEDVQAEVDVTDVESEPAMTETDAAERQRLLGTTEVIDEVSVLGVPEEKLQELYSAIANAVKEEYLIKYNIAPSDFQWPSNEGGKGVPKPWMYLNDKVSEKILFFEEPVLDLAKYDLTEADSQTIELMDIIYWQIMSWIETNGYLDLMSVKWHKIVLDHVVIG